MCRIEATPLMKRQWRTWWRSCKRTT